MTTTRREFFRCLEVALDDMAHTIDGNYICVNNNSKEIAINIAPLPPRELSKTMIMERWQLTIKFSDHDEVESSNFMKKFNRAFHRGGG